MSKNKLIIYIAIIVLVITTVISAIVIMNVLNKRNTQTGTGGDNKVIASFSDNLLGQYTSVQGGTSGQFQQYKLTFSIQNTTTHVIILTQSDFALTGSDSAIYLPIDSKLALYNFSMNLSPGATQVLSLDYFFPGSVTDFSLKNSQVSVSGGTITLH